jgi:hypothetical protein
MGRDGMLGGFCGLRHRARDDAQRRDHRYARRKAAQGLHMPLQESAAPKSSAIQRSRHRFPHAIRAPIQRELWSNTVNTSL